jgi:hypothetical protein
VSVPVLTSIKRSRPDDADGLLMVTGDALDEASVHSSITASHQASSSGRPAGALDGSTKTPCRPRLLPALAVLIALAAVCITAAIASSSALAATGYSLSCSFSGDGPIRGSGSTCAPTPPASNGPFSSPTGTAVDPGTGAVYVADRADNRVLKFDASGTPQPFSALASSQLLGSDTPAGGFSSPTGLAVDPTTHDLYVTDQGNQVVDKFDSTGTYVSQLTGFSFGSFAPNLAVDPTDGTLYVLDQGALVIDKFDAAGEPDPTTPQITGFANVSGGGLAVGPDHNVYVVDNVNGTAHGNVLEFDPTGAPVLNSTGTNTVDPSGTASGVTVDASTGDLFVIDESQISEYTFDQPSTTWSVLYQFGSELGYAASSEGGLAIFPGGELYASNVSRDQVDAFSPFTLGPASSAVAASTNTARASTLLHGSVNPTGYVTTYHFEYVDDADYRAALAAGNPDPYSAGSAGPSATTGNGDSAVPVSLVVDGLKPATLYHVALATSNTGGVSISPADVTFTTGPPLPPAAFTAGASGVSGSSATISGTVDPDGLATSYQFEIGPSSAYGTPVSGSAGAQAGDQDVSASFTGLQPSTTYHYRLSATNADGIARGEDRTFTTSPAPAGLAVALGAGTPYLGALAPLPAGRESPPAPASKPLTRAQKLKRALRACRARRNKTKRKSCEKQARIKYGPKHKAKKSSDRPAVNNRRAK